MTHSDAEFNKIIDGIPETAIHETPGEVANFSLPEYDRLVLRLLCLLNGDITMMGPKPFDVEDRWEEQVAIAVCKATGMKPESWRALNKTARGPWIEETIASLDQGQSAKPPAEPESSEEWSEAKPPADWRKELGGISQETLKRYAREGKLIVDKLTSKSWRIRLDTLRRFTGDK